MELVFPQLFKGFSPQAVGQHEAAPRGLGAALHPDVASVCED